MTYSKITANDLQKWINHLTDEEKELPIIISNKAFPNVDEMEFPTSIGHMLTKDYDGFVVLAKKGI